VHNLRISSKIIEFSKSHLQCLLTFLVSSLTDLDPKDTAEMQEDAQIPEPVQASKADQTPQLLEFPHDMLFLILCSLESSSDMKVTRKAIM